MNQALKAIVAALIAKIAWPQFLKTLMGWVGEWVKNKFKPKA